MAAGIWTLHPHLYRYMDKLKYFINQITPVTEEEWNRFVSLTETFQYEKNEWVLTAGQRCNHVYFVNSGIARFSMMVEGREKTIAFASENELAVEVYSFYSRQPSISSLQALTSLELIGIQHARLEELYHESKNWERFGRMIAQFGVLGQVMEKIDVLLKSPEERYQQLVRHKPYLLEKVNLGIISSYLGITQETLSRIRSRIRNF
jgi:CRP-like cAMP-binding protein